MKFEDFIGMKVTYRSGSNKEYEAIIIKIPERPETCSEFPIVSLIFKDILGKWRKKERVLPEDSSTFLKLKVWKYTEGKYAWKDGLFINDDDLR